MGPALGGTRMFNYANEWEALNDVLRLSRGMTFKAAITGLNIGGKAVIMVMLRRRNNEDVVLHLSMVDISRRCRNVHIAGYRVSRCYVSYVTGILKKEGAGTIAQTASHSSGRSQTKI
jgi:leucine dehydrogenase